MTIDEVKALPNYSDVVYCEDENNPILGTVLGDKILWSDGETTELFARTEVCKKGLEKILQDVRLYDRINKVV